MRLQDVTLLLRPLWRRVLLLAARGVVRAVEEAEGFERLQLELMRGELRDQVERFGALGIASVPKDGAEAVVLFLGGDRGHGFVVGLEDRRIRPQGLRPGETAIYDGFGSVVHLRDDGSILVKPGSGRVVFDADLEVQGDLAVGGAATVDGDVLDNASAGGLSMAAMRATYNVHTHTDPQGGVVGPPLPTMGP